MGRGVHILPLDCARYVLSTPLAAELHTATSYCCPLTPSSHTPHPLRAPCLHDLPSDSRYAADQKDAAGERTAHAFEADPRNEDMLIAIRDGLSHRLVFQWRPAAKVSALDAGFLLGDGVWEGIRVHKGCLLFVWVRLPHPACMSRRSVAGVWRRLL